MEFLKRETYLKRIRPFYQSDLIKILVGMRRCGKSTILKQIMQELQESGIDDSHIMYFNFELMRYRDFCDAASLEAYVSGQLSDSKRYYLFFDEIQRVNDFEDAINSLRVSNDCSIFITGSNGKLLSAELKTELTGRYVEFRIQPFTYREAVMLGRLNGKGQEEGAFRDYIKWGGLPQRFSFDEGSQIRPYLSDVYDSIVVRDIVQRYNVKNPEMLMRITDYLIDNSSRLFSVNSIVDYLKNSGISISTETVYNYVSYAVSSLMIDRVRRFDTRGKKILSSSEKFYCADTGIRNTRSVDIESDIGVSLELIVYNELIARGYDVCIGVTKNLEVDFIADRNGTRSYVQVCYLMSEQRIIDREFGSLLEIHDNYPKYVLSMDEFDMSRDGIIHLNLVEWLLGETDGGAEFEKM